MIPILRVLAHDVPALAIVATLAAVGSSTAGTDLERPKAVDPRDRHELARVGDAGTDLRGSRAVNPGACLGLSNGGAAGSPAAGVEPVPLSVVGLPSGPLIPVAAASADFDGDGIADLAAVYRSGSRGFAMVLRRNPQATASMPARGVAQFLPEARVEELALAPDLAVTGDLDGDGFSDLAVGTRGVPYLTVLLGDGRGRLPGRALIDLRGGLTALAASDVNRPDGLIDLIAAVDGERGPALLVFESPGGALEADPERIPLPAPATALAAGPLRGTYLTDIAAVCGDDLVIVAGRDRRLHTPGADAGAPALVRTSLASLVSLGSLASPESLTLPKLPTSAASPALSQSPASAVVSLAARHWLGADDGRVDLAALTSDGTMLVLRVPEPSGVVTGTGSDSLHVL